MLPYAQPPGPAGFTAAQPSCLTGLPVKAKTGKGRMSLVAGHQSFSGVPFQLAGLTDTDLRRMAELVRRYADRHLGGTDASLIAVCERLAIVTVATVNLRDFANVRPRHVAALAIVPLRPHGATT